MIKWIKTGWITIFSIGLIIGIVFLLICQGNFQTTASLLLIATAIISIIIIIIEKIPLTLTTFFFVPLSITTIIGHTGSALSIPSEFLILVIASTFLFSITFYNKLDKKILFHPLTFILLLDIGWQIFSSIFSSLPLVSMKRVFMHTVFIGTFYLAFAHLLKNKKFLMSPYLLYAFGLIPVIFYTLFKHAAYHFDPRVIFDLSQPFFPEHTSYGASIAFILPALFIFTSKKINIPNQAFTKIIFYFVLPLLIIAEFLSFSRAAMISLLIVFLLYWAIRLFKIKLAHLILLLCSLTLLGMLFERQLYELAKKNEAVSNDGSITNHFESATNVTRDASNLERLNRWICAYRMFKERPLVGFGPGTYQFEYANFQTRDNKTYISTDNGDKGNAHSEYFMYLSETGMPGLIIFLGLVFYTIYLGLKLYYTSQSRQMKSIALAAVLGILTFFTHGIFNSFIDQDKIASLVFSSMAILTAIDVYHKNAIEEIEPVKNLN